MDIKRANIPTVFTDDEPQITDAPIANLYCPGIETGERARQLTRILGARFTIVCPKIYRNQHFPGGIRLGQIYSILLDGEECICGARLESVESERIWDLQDRQLKGVLGIQFVDRLFQWFNCEKFLEAIGVAIPNFTIVSYGAFIDLVEFCVEVPGTDTNNPD